MAANDPNHRAGRGVADRLLLASGRGDPLPLRIGQLPGLDRRSGRAAPAPPPGWRRRGILILVALLSILAGIGISRLRLNDDLRSLLRNNDAEFRLIDEVGARFGSPDNDCIVRATATSGHLFEPAGLEALRLLCAEMGAIEGVTGVRSLYDIRREGAAGALLPLIPRTGEPLDAAACTAALARATRHPLVAGHLLSADASSTLVLVRLASGVAAAAGGETGTLHQIEQAVATWDQQGSPLACELTGLPALREQASRALRRDMLTFNALGLALAVVVSAALARNVRSLVVACLPPFVGALWAMGILGLSGAPVNMLTCVVPSLALVVGTCDSIHFIEDMRRSARRGIAPQAAASGAVQRVGSACGITSIVTAIGFASLAVAKIETVRIFGMAAAAGALASFAAVTLITPLLATSRFFQGAGLGLSSRRAGRLANALTHFSLKHARIIVALGALATGVLALTCRHLDADNRMADALPASAPASRALMGVDRDFGGAMGLDVVLRWPAGTDWLDADVLGALDEIGAILSVSGVEVAGTSIPSVSLATITSSLSDRVKQRLDARLFGDMVDPVDRVAVVRGRVTDLGSRTLEKVYDQIDARLASLEERRPGYRCELSGMSVVSARNIRQLVRDLGSSLVLEVFVIGAILSLTFRSLLVGVVSMIPNIFPVAVIGSLVVWSGRTLDPATVIVFNVCLGLAVDDTVHVLSAVARQRRKGVPIAGAVRRAVAETGNAIVVGGLVLAVGFAAVTVSSVPSLASFGLLACAAVAAATVAELILLPALLVVTDAAVQRCTKTWGDGIFGRNASGTRS